MSWIKDNKFVVALGSGTLVGSILIFLVGMNGMERYEHAKTAFDEAAEQAAKYEALPLYPKDTYCQSKKAALDKYRKDVESLQAAFDVYRNDPSNHFKELKKPSPEAFTNELKKTDKEIREACDTAGTKLPENFFCGFERYTSVLASGDATGILQYELEGVKSLMFAMAESRVTELKKIHCPRLIEEEQKDAKAPKDSKVSKATKDQDGNVARPLPLEISFSGPEKTVRAFLSAIMQQKDKFFVIRSMRISNPKKDPPRTGDVKFDRPANATSAPSANVFGGDFMLPGDEPKPEEKKPPQGGAAPAPAPATPATPAAPAAAPAAAPVAAPAAAPAARSAADSSRILSQVLGNEELEVFIRLDLMRFLPAKTLP